MTAIAVRPMTQADEAFCLQLSQTAGWNQTPEDWRRARELEPTGAWVAEVAGCEAGTSTACRFGEIGWIALMLVAPEFRRRGVGNALFTQAATYLEQQGCRSLRLDATPLGQPLYAQHGFVPEYTLGRFAGTVTPPTESPIEPSGERDFSQREPSSAFEDEITLEPAQLTDLAAIAALDQQITKTARLQFLTQLFKRAPEEARKARCLSDGRLLGYSFSRPGRVAAQLGPCLAISHAAGRRLLTETLQRHLGRAVFVDIPLEHVAATAIATRHGLQLQRHLTRMGKGPRVVEQIEGCFWSGSGPEKG